MTNAQLALFNAKLYLGYARDALRTARINAEHNGETEVLAECDRLEPARAWLTELFRETPGSHPGRTPEDAADRILSGGNK